MRTSRPRGFSLVETLVVLAIVSIALLSITVQTDSSAARQLDAEKKRVGLLIHALSERASILARPHRAVFSRSHLTFYELSPSGWRQIKQSPFEFRHFPNGIFLASSEETTEIDIDAFGAIVPSQMVLRLNHLQVTLSIDALGRWR